MSTKILFVEIFMLGAFAEECCRPSLNLHSFVLIPKAILVTFTGGIFWKAKENRKPIGLFVFMDLENAYDYGWCWRERE